MKEYFPLNCKTHFSVREAIITQKALKKAAINIGIADTNNICGSVQFKNVSSDNIVGINISSDRGPILIYAKNIAGWYKLCKISSIINNNNFCVNHDILKDMIDDTLILIYLYTENQPIRNSYYGIDFNTQDNINEMRQVAKVKKEN
jgi:DNA polymerase III alpha subunit